MSRYLLFDFLAVFASWFHFFPLAGGRTGATLQPQQAVYAQPQQQASVQYQMVQVILLALTGEVNLVARFCRTYSSLTDMTSVLA